MTHSKAIRHRTAKRATIPKADPERALTPLERWYLGQYVDFTAQRAALRIVEPPSLLTFATYIKRSVTPVHQMLARLEAIGLMARDERRRFVLRPGATKAAGL